MLVGAFEIDIGRPFEIGPLLQHEGMVQPDSKQTSRMSSIFSQSFDLRPRKRSAASGANQASAPSFAKASTMRALTASSLSTSPVAL